jgi:hypothetical protein
MHEDHPFTLTHNVAYHGPWTLSESRKRCMSRVVIADGFLVGYY